jgi:hypothetical protein
LGAKGTIFDSFSRAPDSARFSQPVAGVISDYFQRNFVALGKLRQDGAEPS